MTAPYRKLLLLSSDRGGAEDRRSIITAPGWKTLLLSPLVEVEEGI